MKTSGSDPDTPIQNVLKNILDLNSFKDQIDELKQNVKL